MFMRLMVASQEEALSMFWKERNDLPAGVGYPLWGRTHILSICALGLMILLLLILFLRCDAIRRERVIRVLPIIMVGLEVWKDMFLISVHRFTVGYLPLHMCSLGIVVFLLYAWGRERMRRIFGEIAFTLILPSALVAIFDPDWTTYYPPLNFMNIYSYVWHGLLVAYPAMLMLDRRVRPSIRHIHYDLIFIGLVLPPIYLFDKLFSCNYLFVNWPIPNSPLSWLASFMGNPGYLAGYAVLVVLMLLIVYMLYYMVRCFSGKGGRI